MQKNEAEKPSTWLVVTIISVIIVTIAVVGAMVYLALSTNSNALPAYNETTATPTPSMPTPALEPEKASAEEIRQLADSDKIYKNIFVNNIDISGLSKAEAVDKLTKELGKTLDNSIVSYIKDEETFDLSFSDLGCEFEVETTVEKAYNFAREGDYSKRHELISALLTTSLNYDSPMFYTPADIEQAFSKFRVKYETEALVQQFSYKDGKFDVIEGRPGLVLDVKKMTAETRKLLDANKEGQVEIALVEFNPPENELDFTKATSLIGSFDTAFVKGATGRNQNLENSASKISGIVLMPGEVFSTNDTFGEMTAENGYGIGKAYLNGILVDDIGGGVCQVSSTLYCALLYSELEIVQRQNHSLKVGYLEWAFDATLATPSIDLKFKNDTDYPVTLESYLEDDKVVVNIYGYEIHKPGRKLVFENALVSSTPPPVEEIKEDPTLTAGERVVEVVEKIGYKYNLYKLVYQNDVFVEKIHVNTSSYRALRGIIRVGTKANESSQNPVETVTPIETELVTPEPIVTEQPASEEPLIPEETAKPEGGY